MKWVLLSIYTKRSYEREREKYNKQEQHYLYTMHSFEDLLKMQDLDAIHIASWIVTVGLMTLSTMFIN